MTEKVFKSLGCDVAVQVPASIEEYDKLAKREGAALDEAINNVGYRSVLAEFRSNFCDEVEKETGIERKMKELDKKDADGDIVTVPDESEANYIKRVRAEKGWEEDNSTLQEIANRVAAEIVFDPSAPERKPAKPKKLPKKYLEVAEAIIKAGRQDHWASQFGITLTGEHDQDVKLLAAGVKKDQESKPLQYA